MIDKAMRNRGFMVTVATAFVLKLWLTSETRIIPAYAPHDALNFVWHAKSIAMGLWFGHYDELTLIKQPFFPMYMAALQEFGIPLTIAHLLFYGLACFVACSAVSPLVRNRVALAVTFVVLYFNPMENDGNSWLSTRAQINPTLTLLVFACAIGLFLRRRSSLREMLPWSIALGFSTCAFWLTREEAIWIVPALLFFAVAFLTGPIVARARTSFVARGTAVIVPLLIVVAGTLAVMATNGIVYGWATTSENVSPEVVSAYNALARIDPGVPTDRHFPVPHDARVIAYRVSPAANELARFLDGTEGAEWAKSGCTQFNICGDIHGGWFIWALRGAVSGAGYYSSGATARAFYLRLATEIDAACAGKRIACHPKRRTLSPPLLWSDVPNVLANVSKVAALIPAYDQFSWEPWHLVGPASVRPDYDFIVRSVDDGFPIEPAGKDDHLKRAVLNEIGRTYQIAFPFFLQLAVAALLVRIFAAAKRGSAMPLDAGTCVLGLTIGFAALAVILALIETLSFPSFNPEYTGPLFPIALLGTLLVLAIEVPSALRAIEARLPEPKVSSTRPA